MKNKIFRNRNFNTFAMAIAFMVLSLAVNTNFAYGLDNSRLGLNEKTEGVLDLTLSDSVHKALLRLESNNPLSADASLILNKLDDGALDKRGNLRLKVYKISHDTDLMLGEKLSDNSGADLVAKIDGQLRLDDDRLRLDADDLLVGNLRINAGKHLRSDVLLNLDALQIAELRSVLKDLPELSLESLTAIPLDVLHRA